MSSEVAVGDKRLDSTRIKKVDPMTVTIVGIDTTHTSEHPLWDPRINLPLNEGMVISILAHGVKQPIIVREDGTEIEVIEGRQRVRAIREANRRLGLAGSRLLKIPVIFEAGADDRTAMSLMVLANEIRTQDSGISKALKAKHLMDKCGMTVEEVAVEFGVSAQSVVVWLKILACDTVVVDALKKGTLKMSAAREMASMPREEQRAIVEKLVAEVTPALEEEEGAVTAPEKLTAKDVRRAKKGNEGDGEGSDGEEGDGGSSERGSHGSDAPPKVLMNRLVRYLDDKEDEIHLAVEIDDIVIHTLKWALGIGSAKRVKGLSTAIRHINERHQKKPSKKGR